MDGADCGIRSAIAAVKQSSDGQRVDLRSLSEGLWHSFTDPACSHCSLRLYERKCARAVLGTSCDICIQVGHRGLNVAEPPSDKRSPNHHLLSMSSPPGHSPDPQTLRAPEPPGPERRRQLSHKVSKWPLHHHHLPLAEPLHRGDAPELVGLEFVELWVLRAAPPMSGHSTRSAYRSSAADHTSAVDRCRELVRGPRQRDELERLASLTGPLPADMAGKPAHTVSVHAARGTERGFGHRRERQRRVALPASLVPDHLQVELDGAQPVVGPDDHARCARVAPDGLERDRLERGELRAQRGVEGVELRRRRDEAAGLNVVELERAGRGGDGEEGGVSGREGDRRWGVGQSRQEDV